MYLGTTYGFSLSRRRRSGGGDTEQIRWARDLQEETSAWTSGSLEILLSQTPLDEDGLTVLSEGLVLHPDDYTVLTGPDRVRIDFDADPVNDAADGTWSFVITYPYLLP